MELDELFREIANRYGHPKNEVQHNDCIAWVKKNIDKRQYSELLEAILETRPINYGSPDINALKSACFYLQKDKGRDIMLSQRDHYDEKSIEPLTEEDYRLNAELAREYGVDPTKPGWMNQLLFAVMSKRKGARNGL